MATGAVPTPDDYEGSIRTYAFERAEEGRAVRVGDKERSEAAAIVDVAPVASADLPLAAEQDATAEPPTTGDYLPDAQAVQSRQE